MQQSAGKKWGLVASVWLGAVVVVGILAGCQPARPTSNDVNEMGQVRRVCEGVYHASNDPEAFEALFIAGAAPKDRARYSDDYSYGMHADPVFDGDTATVEMEFHDENGGDRVSTTNWIVKKVDGEWKLEKAPLPDTAG